MLLWKRAVLLGILSWLIPFAISFLLFPLKAAHASLFEELMSLAVVLAAGVLLHFYFRGRNVVLGEAVLVGSLWLLIDLVFDYPMFAYGPMKMSAAQYYSEIGAAYLLFPALAFGAALLASSHQRAQ